MSLLKFPLSPRTSPSSPNLSAILPALTAVLPGRLVQTVCTANFALNVAAAQLTHADGREVLPTAMAFARLKVLVLHPNRTLSRDELLDLAHLPGWEPFDRSAALRISHLRRKIEPDPDCPRFIRTVRGIGDMLTSASVDVWPRARPDRSRGRRRRATP
ncbi:MAG: winged helix-turn-helix domain-containing protein [Pseudomonadota bacterium]